MTDSSGVPQKTSHVLHHFDDEIAALRQQIRYLGDEVLNLWGLNHEALIDGNLKLASDVLARAGKVKAIQFEIEHSILAILAKEQPVAGDLRLVVSMIKIAYELHSMVEVAHEMARLILALYVPRHGLPSINLIVEVSDLDLTLYQTIGNLIEALNNWDAQSARRLFEQSLAVESAIQNGIERLIGFIRDNQRQISPALTLLQMMKALEAGSRKGKDLAEYCVYMIDGIDLQKS